MHPELERLRQAVIADNVKDFKELLAKNGELSCVAFGRFPLLSLAFLYEAKRIISKFQKELGNIDNFTLANEYPEDYLLFKKKAGKSLRLYLNGQTVVPKEMAAILGYGYVVNEINSADKTKTSVKDNERIKKIYNLTHAQDVKVKENHIVAPRSKKPRRLELITVIAMVVICTVVLSGAVVSLEVVPMLLGGEGTTQNPIKITSPELFLKATKESTNRVYSLEHDLTLSTETFNAQELNVDLVGMNNTIVVEGEPKTLFKSLKGNLSNVHFVFRNLKGTMPAGSGLIAETLSGKLSNVTVTIEDFELTFSDSSALLIGTVTGTVENLTLNASGKIFEAQTFESNKDENGIEVSIETQMATVTQKNNGIINNASVMLNVEAEGNAKNNSSDYDTVKFGDAAIAGIAGTNNGTIQNSTVLEGSSISTNTVDVGGLVVENGRSATITKCVNNASLTQTTASNEWSPNVAGIAMRNYGSILNTTSNATISATTTHHSGETNIVLGGITTSNAGKIESTVNNGSITATAQNSLLSIGGITSTNTSSEYANGLIYKSANNGNVKASVLANTETQYVSLIGGIAATNDSNAVIRETKNTGNVDFSTLRPTSTNYIGGIVAVHPAQSYATTTIEKAQNYGNITATSVQTENYGLFVGGVLAVALSGNVYSSFNAGAFSTTAPVETVFGGGVIGIIRVQQSIFGTNLVDSLRWESCYYVEGLSYEFGIGSLFNTYTNSYLDGIDDTFIGTDLETIKSSEIYWQ